MSNWQRPLPDDKPAWQAIMEADRRALVNLHKQMEEDFNRLWKDNTTGRAADELGEICDGVSDLIYKLDRAIERLAGE